MTFRTWRISLLIISVLILIFSLAIEVAAITHVEPARFIISVNPGQRRTGTIKVTNKGEEEIAVKAILYDWDLKRDDSLITLEAGTKQETLDQLIKFNPRQFKIAGGKTQVVRFTIRAPENLKKERRGIVFFEEETGLTEESTGAKVVTQIGTAIYFVPSTAEFRFKLLGAKIKVAETEADDNLALLLMENAGQAHIRYTVNYKIINSKGALIADNEVTEKVILPQKTRVLSFAIKEKIPAGKYKMLLQLEFYGTDKAADYTLPFVVE